MHVSIGTKLQNARKSLNISLQEAAEKTKIRTDFLSRFEDNDFDIGLPEVYRQGFLKLYASYLKMDLDPIMKDYRQQRGITPKTTLGPRKDRIRSSILSNSSDEPQQEMGDNREVEFSSNLKRPEEFEDKEQTLPESQNAFKIEKKVLLKMGALFCITLMTVCVVVFGLRKIFKGNSVEIASNQASQKLLVESADGKSKSNSMLMEEVYLVATGNVHVIVRQEHDKKRLFSGNLTQGDRVPIQKQGKIKILFSEGQNILLEKNNQQYTMNAQGNAIRVFE